MSGFFDPTKPVEKHPGGNLPHWRQEGALYFVTFRLADSLPEDRLKELRIDRQKWLEAHSDRLSSAERWLYHRRYVDTINGWLDQGSGSCLFRDARNRQTVEAALTHFDQERYDLGERVVAPNHVHALVRPLGPHSLSQVVHSWKSYTSNELSKVPAVQAALSGFRASATTTQRMRGRTGSIWQKEAYDHMVRDEDDLNRIRDYIAAHK